MEGNVLVWYLLTCVLNPGPSDDVCSHGRDRPAASAFVSDGPARVRPSSHRLVPSLPLSRCQSCLSRCSSGTCSSHPTTHKQNLNTISHSTTTTTTPIFSTTFPYLSIGSYKTHNNKQMMLFPFPFWLKLDIFFSSSFFLFLFCLEGCISDVGR